MTRNKEYHSFMLRFKQMQTDDLQTWIVSMQNTQTGHHQVFSNLDSLIQFLQAEFGSGAAQEEAGRSDAQDTNSTMTAMR